MYSPGRINCNFTYSLLGIETPSNLSCISAVWLQFHLLPIRDWNGVNRRWVKRGLNCNFTYSLLGIETKTQTICAQYGIIAISLTPY